MMLNYQQGLERLENSPLKNALASASLNLKTAGILRKPLQSETLQNKTDALIQEQTLRKLELDESENVS